MDANRGVSVIELLLAQNELVTPRAVESLVIEITPPDGCVVWDQLILQRLKGKFEAVAPFEYHYARQSIGD